MSVRTSPTNPHAVDEVRDECLAIKEAGGGNPRLLERFWSKVDFDGPVASGMETPCWVWIAYRNPKGYGRFRLDGRCGRLVLAHRFAYELLVGDIPADREPHHQCENESCVRPDHLEILTRAEHERRHHSNAHCKNGHELTPENIYRRTDGGRRCKQCRLDYQRQYHVNQRAA